VEKLDTRMIEAWRQAATDLGLRLTAPFDTTDKQGRPIQVEGFLPDFGGPSGITFVSFARRIQPANVGLYGSVLFEIYRKYERSLFIETLEDWGWFGPADGRPGWYAGHA